MVSSATPTMIRIDVPPNCRTSGSFVRVNTMRRHDRDDAEEQRARQRDAVEHVLDVADRRRTRTDAGDEPAVLAQVVREVDRVEDERRVEVGEEHDQHELEQPSSPGRDASALPIVDQHRALPVSVAICSGKNRIADAKMIGTTLAPLILSGMYVPEPP